MDREKVIKELDDSLKNQHCGFVDGVGDVYAVSEETIKKIIALLKEQESTTFKPHYIDKYSKHFICGVECDACHNEISSTYHYCPYCGRSVAWDA